MEKQQEGLPLILSAHQNQIITASMTQREIRLVRFDLTISIIGGILLKQSREINRICKLDFCILLTKSHITDTIAKHNGFSKIKSTETIETILELIKSTLASGEDVMVSGFGKFCVKDKRERWGRNPVTGEDMILAPRRVVTFKCSGKLRARRYRYDWKGQ
jgi:integration host factor subunit alpha